MLTLKLISMETHIPRSHARNPRDNFFAGAQYLDLRLNSPVWWHLPVTGSALSCSKDHNEPSKLLNLTAVTACHEYKRDLTELEKLSGNGLRMARFRSRRVELTRCSEAQMDWKAKRLQTWNHELEKMLDVAFQLPAV